MTPLAIWLALFFRVEIVNGRAGVDPKPEAPLASPDASQERRE